MADRFLLLDARTRTAIAELPVVDSMRFTETLNSPGSWAATIPLTQPSTSAITAANLITPRAIFAYEQGGDLRWAGPILTIRIDRDASTVALSGQGYMNYLRRRVLYTTKTYAAVDQLAIVEDLIDYAQTTFGSAGDLGITTDALSLSTVARDRTYFGYERKFIGTLIEQLAAVDGGFDFRLSPRWTDGPNSTMELVFGVTYPAVGRQTGYVFDLNALDVPTVDVDLTRMAFTVTATGLGTGENLPSSTQSRSALIEAYLLLEDVQAVGDVTEAATLTSYANRRLNVGSTPLIFPTVVLPAADYGAFIPGDQVRCLGIDGILDIGGVYRIAEQTYDLPADGPATNTLTLSPLAAWSN